MEQEATRSATDRSKLVSVMGKMRRTGTLYILLAILMASCKSCSCSGCNVSFDWINQFICQFWKAATGCNQVCQMRIQLVDQNGANLTNVRPGSFTMLQINSGSNPGLVFFSGQANYDANGLSQILQLQRCVDPCNFNFAGNPFAFSVFGFTIRTSGSGCPAGQCRFWGASTAGGNITASRQGCVLILRVPVTQGPCGPC